MDWNEQSEDILERIRTNSVNLSEYHRRRFYHFKSYNKYFRLPCICLAVINSTASVGMTQFGASQEIASGTTCVIGMILALIGAVESYMNIPKQMDDEMKKSKDFYTLAIEIYKTLKLPRSERSEKASDYLTKKFGHYTKLMESSSLLKRKLKHDTLAKIKGSYASTPEGSDIGEKIYDKMHLDHSTSFVFDGFPSPERNSTDRV